MNLNVGLLRKVQAHILKHPEQIEMDATISTNECGTVGCIAGWVLLLTCPKKAAGLQDGDECLDLAAIKLRVSSFAACDLFSPYGISNIGLECGTEEYALAVSQRIDNFIAIHGAKS